jgi:hypothetical protein
MTRRLLLAVEEKLIGAASYPAIKGAEAPTIAAWRPAGTAGYGP